MVQDSTMEELTAREKIILQSIVHNFILWANPVSSIRLSKQYRWGLSSATIRNVMMDLEQKGLICQPYTSAGRVPTDKGYRFYVDGLMKPERLSPPEKKAIFDDLLKVSKDVDLILEKASRVLGKISQQLGIVLAPRFYQGILDKLELVPISERRILVVLTIRSGLVKTIMMELNTKISKNKLDKTARVLNEKLYGLTLRQIKDSISVRMKDLPEEETQFVKYFLDSADTIFGFQDEADDFHFGGTEYIVAQPEFSDPHKLKSMIELLDDREIIVHLLNRSRKQQGISITIGEENREMKMKEYSVITAVYTVGSVTGTLGVIGPTRMRYSKVVPVVDYMAQVLSDVLTPN